MLSLYSIFMKKNTQHIGIAIVFFCHDGRGNVVLAKRGVRARDEHGRWDIGAGCLEFEDASVEGRLRKEIREEYCTEVLSFDFLGFREVHRTRDGEKTHWIALDFRVHVDAAAVKNGEPKKFDAVEWFQIDLLPTPLHSQLSLFLEKYRDHLK